MKKQIINAIVALLLVLMPVAANAAIGTTAGSGSICPGSEADIPISVTNCNGVSAISLALSYDASKVTYLGYQNPSSHFGTNLHVNATGGVVYLTWYSLNAVDFGSEILIELRFEGISGTSALTWNTANCEYSDVNGNVISSTYTNGSVTVYSLPTVTSQPSNVTLTEGQNATFTIDATGTNIAYRWQVSTNGGTTWSNLSNGGVYSNVTTRQMRITGTPLSYNGNRYRCKVTGTCEPEAYSNAALLTVIDLLPTINTTAGTASTCPSSEFGIPVSVTNCNNVGAISLALSYNTNLVTYTGYDNVNSNLSSGMMEINEENGVIYFTWVAVNAPLNIGGANLFELLFESQSGNSNFTWNTSICEYSTPTGRLFPTSFTSGSATIYYVPSITSNPSNKTVTEGSNTTFAVTASGQGLSYRWQVSTDGGTQWSNLSNGTHYSNVTSATMNVLNATLGMDGFRYRCKVSGTCEPVVYSNSAVLHVNPLLPTIGTTLVNATSCQDVEFDANISVTNFTNVGSVSLALNYDTTKLTYHGYENLNSALEDGSLFVNARKGVVYISWMSIDGATIGSGILMSLKFSGIAGSSSLTWYTSRCEYANVLGMVFPDTYQNGTVTIYAAPNITSQPSNKTVYEGSSTSISITATGRTLSYQWQSRPDEGSLWTDLVNGGHYGNVYSSTLNIYNATLDMNGRQYRCVVSGECEPETVSNQAILTVRQLLPTIATGAGSLNTCSGTEFGIPVTVTNFIGVGAVSLALQYNPNILTYTGYEWVNSHLNNGELHVNASDGVVYITWMSVSGATIGNGTLLWINFTGVAGNSSLTWLSASCEYSNTEGYPFPTTFSNGSVHVQQENFEITSHPVDQDVIMGDSTSFSIETEGQNLTFQWCVSEDEGASWTALESGALYAGVNTETLIVDTTTFDMNGYLYRCEVNGSCGLKYSNSALLTVGLAEDFHQVTVTASPENGGEVTGEGVYYVGNSVTITATTNMGWHFVNWTEEDTVVSTNPVYMFSVQEDHDFTAHFELNPYTISVSGNVGGAGELTGGGVYNYGETCTVSAIANEGFTFVCWMRDDTEVTTEPSFSFIVTEDRNYEAIFIQNSYEIIATALPEEGGTVEGDGQYVYGSTCTLTATANTGYVFVNWTNGGVEVSNSPNFSFTVTESASYVAHFMEGSNNYIQTTNLAQGWNWWSTYIELEGVDGLTMLEESLGENGLNIKSQDAFAQYGAGTGGWTGSLLLIDNVSGYKIMVTTECTSLLTGPIAQPENHPITVNPNWNWIGYPVSYAQSIASAMSDFVPETGDVLKGQNGYATYDGSLGWIPYTLVLNPGEGYMYYSNASSDKTLVYTQGRGEVPGIETEDCYWQADRHAYPDNLSLIATVEIEGVEQRDERLELGAFVNGECRGSAHLYYVEPINRYVAFLTVTGQDDEQVKFRLMDESKATSTSHDHITFHSNAIIGNLDDPLPIHFGAMNGVAGMPKNVSIYPNPVDRNIPFTLDIPEWENIADILITNALGETTRYESGSLSASNVVGLPNTGVYLLKVVCRSGNVYFGRLIVK